MVSFVLLTLSLLTGIAVGLRDTDTNSLRSAVRATVGEEVARSLLRGHVGALGDLRIGDSCSETSECPEGAQCLFALVVGDVCQRLDRKSAGSSCGSDSECNGYCHLLKCRNGNPGDLCGSTADCRASQVCQGSGIEGRNCRFPELLRDEGEFCINDSECKGYCQTFKCFDGSLGDGCSKQSDCQSPLTCRGAPGFEKCTNKKAEGGSCNNDNQCLGYCQLLRCYDGSKGDRCGKNSDCQSGNCKFKIFKGKRCT